MLEPGQYPTHGNRGAKRKFPWDELEVSENFIVKDRTMSSFSGAMGYANVSRYPKKFSARTVGRDLYVWRVK